MKSSTPWVKRFSVLLMLFGWMAGSSGCGQAPAPSAHSIVPELLNRYAEIVPDMDGQK